jgi:hypothetical protein
MTHAYYDCRNRIIHIIKFYAIENFTVNGYKEFLYYAEATLKST